MAKEKISCIIAAYNEEKTIGNVLKVVLDHPLVDEVIVVNDASPDKTGDAVRKFKKAKLIETTRNIGKTASVVLGLKKARNRKVMLLDADLVSLTREDLTRLIEPVLKGKANISISLRKNSLDLFKWIGLDFISGERVLDKTLLSDYKALLKLPGFGLESYMNTLIINDSLKIKVVPWQKVTHVRKSEKMGFWVGMAADIKMIVEILKTIGLPKVLMEIAEMKKLQV